MKKFFSVLFGPSVRSTVAGYAGAAIIAAAGVAQQRLADPKGPPITSQTLAVAAGLAILGRITGDGHGPSKDGNEGK